MPLLAVVLACASCSLMEPYDRTNPFDSGSPYKMQLANVPDSVHSIGERFTAEIVRDPPMPDYEYTLSWISIDQATLTPSLLLQPTFGGEYMVSNLATSSYRVIAIGARFDSAVIVGRTVAVGQRTAVLDLTCAAASCEALTPSAGATIAMTADAKDARGNGIRGLTVAMERAVVTSRNPAVVVPAYTPNASGVYHLAALTPGTAWVVVRMDIAVDSVLFTVVP